MFDKFHDECGDNGFEIRQRIITPGAREIAALKTAYTQAFETYVR